MLRRLHVSVDVDAPSDGRQITRVNWLVRQLKDAPPQLRIDSSSHMSRQSMSELLSTAREAPEKLIEDPKKNIRSFRVTATSTLGTKRGAGRGGFVDSVLSSAEGFYEAVVQDLRPWVTKALQLPASGRTAAESAGIDIAPPPLDLQEDENATESQSDRPDQDAESGLVEEASEAVEPDFTQRFSGELDELNDDAPPWREVDATDGTENEVLLDWVSVADRDAERID